MIRHLQAYLIILLIYYIPPVMISPSGWLYFVSIAAWSWISAVIYLNFIKLRCATILCAIEVCISLCAIIALGEYQLALKWFFYSNIEIILDAGVVLELMTITISLIGETIGLFRNSRYNKPNRPVNNGRSNPD